MKKRNLLIGLISGLAAGAAGSLLLAPKSGKETRQDVKNKWNTWKETRQTEPYQQADSENLSTEDVKVSVYKNEAQKEDKKHS